MPEDTKWIAYAGVWCGLAGLTSGLVVVYADDILMAYPTLIPHATVGMTGGLAWYLWRVTEGGQFHTPTALLKTVLGGAFGFLGGQAAAGFGLSAPLQTASAGLGGGMGPRVGDMILDRVIGQVQEPRGKPGDHLPSDTRNPRH